MIEIEGMDELIRRIEDLGNEGVKARDEAVKSAGDFMKDKIKENTPVRTGNLKEQVKTSDVDKGEVLVEIDQQGDGFYGYFVEFGRKAGISRKGRRYPGMAPQPFVAPAYEWYKHLAKEEMAKTLRKVFKI